MIMDLQGQVTPKSIVFHACSHRLYKKKESHYDVTHWLVKSVFSVTISVY